VADLEGRIVKPKATSTLCRRSEIRIPNDPAFGPAAARYVAEVARFIGFSETDLQSVERGVSGAITALIRYSFEPGEDADLIISCEHIAEGLKVTLNDRGLPFGAAEMSMEGRMCAVENGSELCSRILALKGDFDEVSLHNLGPEGKETVLIKHTNRKSIVEHEPACDLRPFEAPAPHFAPSSSETRWTVRRIMPAEAPEVSKLVYRSYGYTYHDYAYFPEKIVALNESQKIHSVVAIADGKEIAGHCVLQFHEDNPRIAEMAQAVVKPEYRSRGCLRAMTEYLVRLAYEKGLHGLFTRSVTEHLFSQKTAHRFGFKDCALLLGIIPRGTQFKSLVHHLAQRGSLLVQFRSLLKAPHATCFAPSGHREMIAKLYVNLGIEAEIKEDFGSSTRVDRESALRVHASARMQFARIVIERSGTDIVNQVQTAMRALLIQRFEVIQLYLDLSDSSTARLTGALEDLGFFFAGILPEGFAHGDGLILQFLNNVPIDYDAIKVESKVARELLAYIRANDPNQG
jgi:serine/threonine-protein kinase RsbW